LTADHGADAGFAEFRAAIEDELITIDGKRLGVWCSFGRHTVVRGGAGRDEVVREAEATLSRAKLVGRISHVIAAESERRA
jgi:GGDEF domain-containing protein